jgi:hypothetical protein
MLNELGVTLGGSTQASVGRWRVDKSVRKRYLVFAG